ncbi:MAG: 50S ribosomal protein L11 methyltransferase [Paludibacteraceae bacterium]|nr:50S ribosomal protein L11 methyltransferase [Paludibacteraceae bacterium]
MRYHVIHIRTSFAEEWQRDVFDQQFCDLGVDTIDAAPETGQDGHTDYYIPSELWRRNQTAIREFLSPFRFPFSVSELPDENWNAAWEAEHPKEELPLGVTIIPHCAFGAGHHETTSMMIDALINHQSSFVHRTSSLGTSFDVLDNGCGTGVLAIFAKKMGADHVLAIDIDEKSVENAKENAVLNGVQIDVRLADLSSLSSQLSPFNLILANIHRNVLLAQMPTYAHLLTHGGQVWLSGFYHDDCPALIAAANDCGLRLLDTRSKGDWSMLRLEKN